MCRQASVASWVLAMALPWCLSGSAAAGGKCPIVYVPTEEAVVEKMLDMAAVNKDMMDVVKSVNRMIDLANLEKQKKKLPHLSLKDAFAGKLDGVSARHQKELEDALKNVNNAIDKINAETTKGLPHVTLADLIDGKSDFAAPAMVKLLKELQKKSDVVYDLGCGDGRIVAIAAKKFGARGVGIDIDPERIKDCMATMKKYGLTKDQVEYREGDALKVKDLDKATVITFYMLPQFMEKLEPQVKKLKPGTRLVAHDYPFPNMKPDVEIEFAGPYRGHTLYMWTLRGDEDKK